ncbi:MAG: Shedu immune nuclease family protein [Candidatus Acidiferrales bacterium]
MPWQTDFVVGRDNFSDLIINLTAQDSFYYFSNQRDHRLIKRFVLDCTRPNVLYCCEVSLIKKKDKFTPRLHLTVRDQYGRLKTRSLKNGETIGLKASVSLKECYVQFWQLISYLKTLGDIEGIPEGSFSLVSKKDVEIVAALRERDPESIKSIIKQLSAGVPLSQEEVNELLQRKKRLKEFEDPLVQSASEHHWQDFFEDNKWIFGYGLNYVILSVQGQAYVGGKQFNRRGGQTPDFIGITSGDVRFTVLVEIKMPSTSLLDGTAEMRNGAWSLSKELTDALAQTQANVDRWNREGARTDENRDTLERAGIYTVKPKGIIVIGRLAQVRDDLHKLQTFERFRRSIYDVEIITFDELFDRARFIVEHTTS